MRNHPESLAPSTSKPGSERIESFLDVEWNGSLGATLERQYHKLPLIIIKKFEDTSGMQLRKHVHDLAGRHVDLEPKVEMSQILECQQRHFQYTPIRRNNVP